MAKGNPGPNGCGGVLQDHDGNFISTVVLPLGIQTNHIVKAIGAYQSLILVKNHNFSCVWVEGDSKNIINCLRGTSKPSWNVEMRIKKTSGIIKFFDKCIISHVYRQANVAVDYLSNKGVTSKSQLSWTNGDMLDSDFVMHFLHD